MRVNKTLTIVSGSPINIVTGLTTSTEGRASPVWVRSVFIQGLLGGSGYIAVMDGIYGVAADGISPRIPSGLGATSGDLTAQLAPATATAPGGNYGDQYPVGNQQAAINARIIWIDGSHTADTVVVSYDVIEGKL